MTSIGFNDPWNPTPDELVAWAYDQDADEPVEQDWDIAAARRNTIATCLRLAADRSCPRRFFFLSCLYLFVGDAHRSGYAECPREDIQALAMLANSDVPEYIMRWSERTCRLLAGRLEFTYEGWCGGEFARDEKLASAGSTGD